MVGDILRREREKQGLTIADIEQGTSIRRLYIGCIEQGKVEELPGMVYAKGFVRNYAKFLGLDAEALVQQFAEENGSAPAPTPAPAEPEAAPKRISLSNVGDESLSQISIGSPSSSYAGIFGKLAVGIVVLVALVGGGVAVISAINSPAKETATAPPVKTEQPVAVPAAAEAAATDEARAAAANADGVRVSVNLTERCWTEVSVDGKPVFEGILEKGKSENWQGKESVVVRVGNAGALDVSLNGKQLGKFGDNGEVLERRFTKTTKELKDTLSPAGPDNKAPTANPKDARNTANTK